MSYYEKYLKYKNKYLEIKKQSGGKIEWKYTHDKSQLDQELVEKEYQTWISLGKPDNYSNNEVRFPLYTFRGKTIMRSSDQVSSVPVDVDCDLCELRLASYPENWRNFGYVPPGQIYAVYVGFDDFGDKESRFIDDVKFRGGCIKCRARKVELEAIIASQEAAQIAFEQSLRSRLGPAPSQADMSRKLGPAPSLADLSRKLGPAPSQADMSRKLGPVPSLADLSRKLGPAPSLADLSRKLGPAPTQADLDRRLGPAPTLADLDRRLDPSPSQADLDRRLGPAPTLADLDRRLDPSPSQAYINRSWVSMGPSGYGKLAR